MGRQKEDLTNLETCERCQSLLQDGAEQCSSCGKPTRFMSFKTRAEYEVEQWRRYKDADATVQVS
jgi:predicted amidophosphoribosyltransferase